MGDGRIQSTPVHLTPIIAHALGCGNSREKKLREEKLILVMCSSYYIYHLSQGRDVS